MPHRLVSDDTVLHLATAEGLVEAAAESFEAQMQTVARHYKRGMRDMAGRAAGGTTISSMERVRADGTGWDAIPFTSGAWGCGAAMRAMCLGLRYPFAPTDAAQRHALVAAGVETGRITHHHPCGYLGGVVVGYFTALALHRVPPVQWGRRLLDDILPLARAYVREAGREVEKNLAAFDLVETAWTLYLRDRGLEVDPRPDTRPLFPAAYGVAERDAEYHRIGRIEKRHWPGATGLDAPLIAYDAYLSSRGDYLELCRRGVLHGGDNDSTGCMCLAWFGAEHGYPAEPVRSNHTKELEYASRMQAAGASLFRLAVAEASTDDARAFLEGAGATAGAHGDDAHGSGRGGGGSGGGGSGSAEGV